MNISRRNTPTATEKVDEDDPKNFKEVASPQPTHEAIEMALSIMVEREEEDVFGPANMPMGYEELDRSKPTQRRKYPNLKNKYAEKKKYSSPDWPDKEECKAYVSRYLLMILFPQKLGIYSVSKSPPSSTASI